MNRRANQNKALLGLLALSGLTGCLSGGYSADERSRLVAMEADGKALSASADALEERLMGSQAALEMWSELGRRHQSVSAMACNNQTAHWQSMLHSVARAEPGERLQPLASADRLGRRDLPRLPRMAQASGQAKHW